METLSIKEPSIKVKPTGKDEKRHDGWMDGGMNGRTQGPDFERESDQIVITCTHNLIVITCITCFLMTEQVEVSQGR